MPGDRSPSQSREPEPSPETITELCKDLVEALISYADLYHYYVPKSIKEVCEEWRPKQAHVRDLCRAVFQRLSSSGRWSPEDISITISELDIIQGEKTDGLTYKETISSEPQATQSGQSPEIIPSIAHQRQWNSNNAVTLRDYFKGRTEFPRLKKRLEILGYLSEDLTQSHRGSRPSMKEAFCGGGRALERIASLGDGKKCFFIDAVHEGIVKPLKDRGVECNLFACLSGSENTTEQTRRDVIEIMKMSGLQAQCWRNHHVENILSDFAMLRDEPQPPGDGKKTYRGVRVFVRRDETADSESLMRVYPKCALGTLILRFMYIEYGKIIRAPRKKSNKSDGATTEREARKVQPYIGTDQCADRSVPRTSPIWQEVNCIEDPLIKEAVRIILETVTSAQVKILNGRNKSPIMWLQQCTELRERVTNRTSCTERQYNEACGLAVKIAQGR